MRPRRPSMTRPTNNWVNSFKAFWNKVYTTPAYKSTSSRSDPSKRRAQANKILEHTLPTMHVTAKRTRYVDKSPHTKNRTPTRGRYYFPTN
jgi:hypothetical protein